MTEPHTRMSTAYAHTPNTYLSLWRGEIPVPRYGTRRLSELTFHHAVTDAARLFGVTVEQIEGQSQTRAVARARQYAMFLLRQVKLHGSPRYSFPEIGRLFGKDHTTVIHACRAVEKRLAAQTERVAA